MTLLKRLLERLQQAPRLVELFELQLLDLKQTIIESRSIVGRLHEIEGRIERTVVYVLPPETPMMAQSAFVSPGTRHTLTFNPHRPLEAGTWIVGVGPALVSTVRVGNTFQSSCSDYQGQVCQTKDECQPGVNLYVELEGWTPRATGRST